METFEHEGKRYYVVPNGYMGSNKCHVSIETNGVETKECCAALRDTEFCMDYHRNRGEGKYCTQAEGDVVYLEESVVRKHKVFFATLMLEN